MSHMKKHAGPGAIYLSLRSLRSDISAELEQLEGKGEQ
jgi:hypothetical protein